MLLRLSWPILSERVPLTYSSPNIPNGIRGEYVGFSASSPSPPLVDERVASTVKLRNARQRRPFSLSRDGFSLFNWPTSISNFADTPAVLQNYVPEMEALVEHSLGAAAENANIIVWDLCVRDSDLTNELQEASATDNTAGPLPLDLLAPVSLAHVDFHRPADVYARLRQRTERPTDTLSSCMAINLDSSSREAVLKHIERRGRVVSLNVWRSIDASRPIRRSPLALCEPASVRSEEIVPFAIVCPDAKVVESHVTWSNRHRWWWWPEMVRDECLCFVSGDTAEELPAVPHASFEHPNSVEDDPPRRSIEARVFVLFDR